VTSIGCVVITIGIGSANPSPAVNTHIMKQAISVFLIPHSFSKKFEINLLGSFSFQRIQVPQQDGMNISRGG
jgi:hypothetical protein